MKVNIVYQSKYGNGKVCVDHLTEALKGQGNEVHVFSVLESDPRSLPEADLYVFSCPTHARSIPGKTKKFIKRAPVLGEGTRYTALTTYASKTFVLEQMDKLAGKKGWVKATDGLSLVVTSAKGPLEEGYQQKLDDFAARIGQ